MLELHVNKIALKKIFRRAVQAGYKMLFVFVLFSKDPSSQEFQTKAVLRNLKVLFKFFFLGMSVCNGQHSLCLYV